MPQEDRGRGGTDGDVIAVPEGAHHRPAFLLQDRLDRPGQLPGRNLVEPAVGEAEPFVAVRFPPGAR